MVWVYLMIAAASNAVNLTDGLDGLATGASAWCFGAYVIIGVWQYRNACGTTLGGDRSATPSRDPLDLAVSRRR